MIIKGKYEVDSNFTTVYANNKMYTIAKNTGEIAERLADADLPPLVWSFDPQDYTFDSVCYELDYTDEEIKEEAERCLEMVEKFNDDIESYLAKIDKKHGTDYCPSGWTRLC